MNNVVFFIGWTIPVLSAVLPPWPSCGKKKTCLKTEVDPLNCSVKCKMLL
jgi:hypothetical protein